MPGTRSPDSPAPDAEPRARALARRLVWLPALLGPVFLALLAVRLPRLLRAVHANGDATAPALIAEALGHGGAQGGPTVLGDISYLTTLGAFWSTRWLPGHRRVWDTIPILLALAGALLLAWAVWRVGGRWAAATSFALATAVGSDALFTQLAPAFHGTTWFTNALLGAALVGLVAGRGNGRGRMWIAGALGVACGANLASDPLLAVTGLGPAALATWLVTRDDPEGRARRGLAGLALGLALVVAVGLTLLATAADIRTRRLERGDSYLVIAAWDDLVRHLDQLWRNALAIFGAGRDGGLDVWPDLPLAIAAVSGLAIAVVCGVRALTGSARTRGAMYRVHVIYWSSALVLLAFAFVLSGIPDPDATVGRDGLVIPDRYLVPFVFCLAAVVPVWAGNAVPRRLAVAGMTTLLCGAAVAALWTNDLARPREALPAARQTERVASWARERGLTRGYGDYWTAASFTYRTGLPVRGIVDCDLGPAVAPCPLRVNARRGWFRPQPGGSFVIVDRSTESGRIVGGLVARRALGVPVERRDFGRLTVLRYERDVALRLGGRWGAGAA